MLPSLNRFVSCLGGENLPKERPFPIEISKGHLGSRTLIETVQWLWNDRAHYKCQPKTHSIFRTTHTKSQLIWIFLLNFPPQKRAGRFELYKRYWLLGKKKESKNMETHAFNWFHSRNAFQLPFDSFVVWCFLLNVSPKKLELSDDSKVIKLQVMRYILSSC